MNKTLKPIYNALMTIICFTFFLCAATWLVLSLTPIYDVLAKAVDIADQTGYSFEICQKNYNILIEYNMFWGAQKLVFPDFIMSEHGEIHFMEVKNIFVGMQIAAMVCAPLTVLGYLYGKKKGALDWLKWVIILAAAVIVTFGTWIAIDWMGFFVTAHKILFTNDYWLFDPTTDPIIWILPDELFLVCAALILALIVGGLVACGVLYKKNCGKKKAKAEK